MARFGVVIGSLLLPSIWCILSYAFAIPERFLPKPASVLRAIIEIQPNVFWHLWLTTERLVIGSVAGTLFGLVLTFLVTVFRPGRWIMLPIIQQARAVPPAALVPFLLLWFGFSEIGKYLLVVSGIGFNLAIAGIQIVQDVPERYRAAFVTFPLGRFKRFMYFDVYRILENLLPAIRVSVAIALGLVIVAEYLGSQAGLGYLIQASRSTFALQTVVLCVILLGILAAIADMIIVWLWVRIIYWRR